MVSDKMSKTISIIKFTIRCYLLTKMLTNLCSFCFDIFNYVPHLVMKQEFSNIIRRAFATRLFPPEVVDKLGKCSVNAHHKEQSVNFAFYMYMYIVELTVKTCV